MKCYFHGTNSSDDVKAKDGVISFAIPDIGVVYRTKCKGDRLECEYLALAALLEFLNANHEVMSNQNIEILGDSTVVVYQLNGKMPVFSRLQSHYRRIEHYKSKIKFKISWTPASLNRAAMVVPKLPPLKADVKFDYSFAEKKRHDRGSGPSKPPGSPSTW
jgi:hypothetical protein